MQPEELRALQAPLKEAYRTAPERAMVTLRASGSLDETAISCHVDTGRALVEAGLHAATGGTGLLACSGDLLLQALVACAGVTLRAVATALAIPCGAAKCAPKAISTSGDAGGEQGRTGGIPAIRRGSARHRRGSRAAATLEKLTSATAWCCRRCAPSPSWRSDLDLTPARAPP